MKVLDLFSGIGGFSLGLERAGMETVAFCEIEEYPRSILKKHWPDVPIYNDVRQLKGDELGTIDVICGGFPCQPFSVAGKQKGKEDNRHLWPEMFRLIQECRPRWVIGENVAGFIRMALDDVLLDLEAEGYSTRTFVIPACAVGGIHQRDRVWIVAHAESVSSNGGEPWKYDESAIQAQAGAKSSNGITSNSASTVSSEQSVRKGIVTNSTHKHDRPSDTREIERQESESGKENQSDVVADTISEGLQGSKQQGAHGEKERASRSTAKQSYACKFVRSEFQPISIPTQPTVRKRDDGLPDNVARLKALGNAVVPQIPEMIGRAILSSCKQ